jgi:hypothetical protein
MMWTRFAAVLLVPFLLGYAAGRDEPVPRETADQKERLESMKRQAAEYELTLKTESPTRLALHAEPLLRFSNPVGGVTDGIVVMWKEGKRPAVFGQIFRVKDGFWIHECQSLASAGLSLKTDKEPPWHPEEAAQKFTPLPDAPRAAKGAVQRLVQMKAQAARFSANDDFRMHVNDPETSRYRLRLLAKPVYRYQDSERHINDGVVFAFVHGTDPELFLILEHRGDGDRARWYYSLVPMTCWAVKAQLDGREIWSVPERYGKSTPRGPYHVWIHRREK